MIKVGDLICYNAAGQRDKTMGLVLEIKYDIRSIAGPRVIALVYWAAVGKFMPRKTMPFLIENYAATIKSGDICWHADGHWFEVING